MNSKKNILLGAYACEPNKGSEPGVGWETAVHLAIQDNQNNYFVVTRKNNKFSIESENYPSNLKFIYYELPSLFLFLKRQGGFVRIYYYLWMLGAVVKLWGERHTFNIIHHITFVNDWLPSLFVLLKTRNSNFIWGPIGSHNKINNKFLYSRKDRFIEFVRICLQKFYRKFDPFFIMCKWKSSKIIGINNEVKFKLKLNEKQLQKFTSIPAIALNKKQINKAEILHKHTNPKSEMFNIISVGRLMYIKNFILSMNCFAKFLEYLTEKEKEKIKLKIIGEGEQKAILVAHAKKIGIFSYVDFIGQITQSEVMNLFANSKLFLFPTLESAGFVVIEAMVNYLPVIALDYGGPKQFIKDYKNIQLTSIKPSISDIEHNLSLNMLELYSNEELRKEIGIKNHQHILKDFTWNAKSYKLLEIYSHLNYKLN